MSYFLAQSDATRIPLADDSVDLVFTSCPYVDCRTYGIGAQRDCREWIDWMLPIIRECVRVSRGLVLVNCAGVTRDWCYWPAPEGLLYRWWESGGRCWRPAFWHRVGIPGSGGEQWLRADVEYVLAFTKCEAKIPWANNTANGHIPKWAPGGEMSYRQSNGSRRNAMGQSPNQQMGNRNSDGSRDERKRAGRTESLPMVQESGQTSFVDDPPMNTANVRWGNVGGKKGMGAKNADGSLKPNGRPSHTKCGGGSRRQNGDVKIGGYDMPVLANPGNLLKINVGGGALGHSLSHVNEAPFPIDLPKWFIRSHCPPGGIVLDCFSGSGSTGQAAIEEGRRYIGFDIRMNQCELGKRRLNHSQPPLFVSGAAQ